MIASPSYRRFLRMIDAVGVSLILALTIGAYVTVVRPALDRADRQQAKEAAIALEAQEIRDLKSYEVALGDYVDSLEQEISSWHFELRPMGSLNAHIADLNELASLHRVQIEEIKLGEAKKGEHSIQLPMQLIGNASFAAVTRFLHELHDSHPDTEVRSFVLTGEPAQPQQPAHLVADLVWNASQ